MGSYDVLYIFLILMNVLFFVIVLAYVLFRMDRKNKVLNKRFIVGGWERHGTSPSSGQPWAFRYDFTADRVTMRGRNPEFQAQGRYRILKEDERLLTLYVFDLSGDGELDPRALYVAVNRAKQEMYIDRRLYRRVED